MYIFYTWRRYSYEFTENHHVWQLERILILNIVVLLEARHEHIQIPVTLR
jgi:hypothetical protein